VNLRRLRRARARVALHRDRERALRVLHGHLGGDRPAPQLDLVLGAQLGEREPRRDDVGPLHRWVVARIGEDDRAVGDRRRRVGQPGELGRHLGQPAPRRQHLDRLLGDDRDRRDVERDADRRRDRGADDVCAHAVLDQRERQVGEPHQRRLDGVRGEHHRGDAANPRAAPVHGHVLDA
jgi:hypothetical protein